MSSLQRKRRESGLKKINKLGMGCSLTLGDWRERNEVSLILSHANNVWRIILEAKMKIKECLELAVECDLETIGEAIFNVEVHAPSLFAYSEMKSELEELDRDYHEKVLDNSPYTEDSKVKVVLDYLEQYDSMEQE